MAENFKILDQNLSDYVKDEVKKRHPDYIYVPSSLGQGRLSKENRYFHLFFSQDKVNYIKYYQGKLLLHIDNGTKINRESFDESISFENNEWRYNDIITHEAGNRGLSDAAVLDAVLRMIEFYHSLTQPIQETNHDSENKENLCKEQIVETINLETTTLKDLFSKPLSLPDYQRAYEWKDEHVNALLEDTYDAFTAKKTYILGTIILHQNKEGASFIISVSLPCNPP